MCLYPKNISNNTHRFAVGKSLLSFDVNCGKCDDCRQQKKNEWFLRCYYEYLQNKSLGSCFFLTLTYADEFLPHFDISYKGFEDGFIVDKHLSSPCFSYSDIHTFIKSFRKILQRKVDSDIKLRYIIFSEYGSKTQRPHYHCLFYVNKKVPKQLFFRCIDGYDNDVERHKFYKFPNDKYFFRTPEHPDGLYTRGAWHKGWVLVSKPDKGGMVVRNQKSILYCSKYACKDLAFYEKPDVLDYQKSLFDPRLYNELERRERISQLRHCLPVHYNSPSLGFKLLKTEFMADYNKYIRDGFLIQVGQKSSVSYRLPEYYKRKILYRYDVQKLDDGSKKIVWYYSPDAKLVHLAYLRNKIKKMQSRLEYVFGVDFVNILQPSDLLQIGYTKDSLREYLNSVKQSFTPYQIAIFNFVYHCRSCRYDVLDGAEPVNNLIHYVSNYEKYYINFIDNNNDFDYGEKYLDKNKGEFKYSYDTLSCFSGLSEFLSLYNNLYLNLRDYELNFRKFLDDYRDLFIPCGSHNMPYFDTYPSS